MNAKKVSLPGKEDSFSQFLCTFKEVLANTSVFMSITQYNCTFCGTTEMKLRKQAGTIPVREVKRLNRRQYSVNEWKGFPEELKDKHPLAILLGLKKQTDPMDASRQFCPNLECRARGQMGQGNIVIHCRKRPRYRCKSCGKTFSAKEGTLFAGLRKPSELVVTVITGLSYGCPVQAIVHAFGLDERTVASWRDRAGKHCEQVHQQLVEHGHLDLVHVQADEIRVKGCKLIAWMGLAMMVSTRLWLAGAVSLRRDMALADRLMRQVRACVQSVRAVLVCTDGWSAYPNSIRRAFREKAKRTLGGGRACLEVWPQLHIGTVIKHTINKRLIAVTCQIRQGTPQGAFTLLQASQGGNMLNTSFIERLKDWQL